MRSIQGALSEVAYAERSCQYLTDALRAVETTVQGITELADIQESGIEAATRDTAGQIRYHLELATRYAEEWRNHIENIAT
ncbi:hypothetical protein QWJ26_26515 [Streptomyces sp. CSDS2]|uniref:hypothetical protein n=1 Tax=Streptomyces sp. CSDS2 TaxID=3055051 RepID=UPI0025B13A61|nr:hypothetical protein [Streptomyces sp. CSDS2]MDN3263299.1 hypothetical protein [Streptomyces sp. CSDS2]